MAEVTGLRNNALPYPIYGVPYGVVFPMLDADGDLVTGATTPDAERSLNGDTFADCTNESTEIATASGMYYLLLTAAEMTADVVAVIAKSATAGMKTTAVVFYPRKLVSLRAGTAAGGAAGSITLDSSASAVDDYYNGCVVVGTLDGAVEARVITGYVGSTKVASVTPNWNTTPDADDTFVIYLPEGRQVQQSDPVAWLGAALPSPHTAGYPIATIKDGTGTGELDTAAGVVLAKDHAGANLATAAAVDAVDNFVDTEIGAIISAIAALNNLSAAQVNAEVDTALADYDGPTNTELATAFGTADDVVLAAIAALNNLSAAQVNVEVVDALNVDTYGEPTGVPAATAAIAAKIGFVFMALRNRIDITASKKQFFDDGGAVEWEKDLSDDGTTFSESEANAP